MIVRMAKIEIVGLKPTLQAALATMQRSGSVHIETECIGFVDDREAKRVQNIVPDEKIVLERIFLQDFLDKSEKLFSQLPPVTIRDTYLNPQPIIDTLNTSLDGHLNKCSELRRKQDSLRQELQDLQFFEQFMQRVGDILAHQEKTPDLEYVAITLTREEDILPLERKLNALTGGMVEMLTEPMEDGSLAGLIILEKERAAKIRDVLKDSRLPEYQVPAALKSGTYEQKMAALADRLLLLKGKIEAIETDLRHLAERWGPWYRSTRRWALNRLKLIQASFSVFESEFCFFIYGWMACDDVAPLQEELDREFAGDVALHVLETRREELNDVPVMLKNSGYFKPFEVFTRLLPLPSYASYDPTPFIAIFFPVFFGMILGDAGYGILLAGVGFLLKKMASRKIVKDVGFILLICSAYSIVFGLGYGEFVGELGHRWFGLKPLIVNRQEEILPMLMFAITVGVGHILLGLLLSLVAKLKLHAMKGALLSFLELILVSAIVLLVAVWLHFVPASLVKPLVIAILALLPLLIFAGGLLAPLELLKHAGNIISYARIMAIGLTSVLLASVANQLSGLIGDVVLGVLVAALIHLLNIVLGVFSPTVHSLRLHYVEFFGKFIEHGGKPFDPLKKHH